MALADSVAVPLSVAPPAGEVMDVEGGVVSLPPPVMKSVYSSRLGEPVPGLNRGGWHDAGDDDLRVESQADTMRGLALAWEAFHPRHDDKEKRCSRNAWRPSPPP